MTSVRRRPSAVRGAAMLVAFVVAVLSFTVQPAAAADKITGAGSTFAKIAIDQWVRDVSGRGLQVNYQGSGSSQGRNLFKGNTVDWASSDIPFENEEQPVGRPYTYLPLVAGGTALMYNLVDTAGRRIDVLKLSGDTIARIFTGQIRNWRAQEILDDNPQIAARIPDQDIKAIVRSGGSGTSAVFTGYMAAVAPSVWQDFASRYGIPGNFTSTFPDVPGFVKQPGSSEIASFVSNPNAGRGSIGYAEAGYAHQARLSIAYVDNAAGKWTLPTARNVAVALLAAQRNPDGTQNLASVYFNSRDETYAISSYNYLIAPTDIGDGKGETLLRFITYAVTDGQSKAAPLGYSPLPPNLCDQALEEALKVPAPAAAKDEARSWIGRCGDHYTKLDAQKPIVIPTDPQTPGAGGPGAGNGNTNGGATGPSASGRGPSGPKTASGPAATEGAVVDPGASTDTSTADPGDAAAADELGETELAADLVTRLQTDASGRAVLSSDTRATLSDAGGATTRLLVVGLIGVVGFFVLPVAGQAFNRRRGAGGS